jgi:hypothetical protein
MDAPTVATQLSPRPMRALFVEFDELYARHLCRHSQFGINVAHIVALFVIWYAIYGLLYWMTGIEWTLAIPVVIYVAALAANVPFRILAATALFVALIIATVLLLPQPPFWVFLVMIPLAYKLQAWSHRFHTMEMDMTDFNRKYRKGRVLFVVLLLYEVPIIMNYFFLASNAVAAAPATEGHQTVAPVKASSSSSHQGVPGGGVCSP